MPDDNFPFFYYVEGIKFNGNVENFHLINHIIN